MATLLRSGGNFSETYARGFVTGRALSSGGSLHLARVVVKMKVFAACLTKRWVLSTGDSTWMRALGRRIQRAAAYLQAKVARPCSA